ncbi:MAG: SRPBCC family protein [Chloroflexota bacterium]
MFKFTKSVFISRSQKDVFDFLSNPANMPQWQSAVESAEWTSTGVPDVGSTYKAVVKMPGGKSENIFEITHWAPPNRYSYKSVKFAIPGSINSSFTLTPKDSGTQLTFEAQLETAGIFKIAERVLGKQAEKAEGNTIETLKQLLETG